MANISYWHLHFLFFAFLALVTRQDCPANTQLPAFYKYSVSLEVMKKGGRQTPDSTKHALYYSLNYPFEFLSKTRNTNINTLLSIHKQQTSDFPVALNYKIKQLQRPIGLQIFAQSNLFVWKSLEISIILFSKQVYSSLNVGYLSLINQQSRMSLTGSSKLSYPYKKNTAKSLIFINGINMAHSKALDYEFEINVNEVINYQTKQLGVTVNVGQSTRLVQIYLAYIVYESSQIQYQVSGMYLGLYDVGIGAHSLYLGNQLSGASYLFAGVSSFRFKKGPGQFKIALNQKPNSQNVLEVTLASPFSYLNTGIFRIGNKGKNICKQCPKCSIQSTSAKTLCVTSCKSGVTIKDPVTKVQSCLICPAELNFGVVNGKCACLSGFKFFNGQCLNQALAKIGLQRTMSVAVTNSISNSDCVDPNQYKSGQSCICKPGYQKQPSNNNLCTSICPNGYYNGQKCISCAPGTYPYSQFQTCLSCGNNCINCRSQYNCQQCTFGFELNNEYQCKQKCGDGMKIYDECDDGNNIDGDGCSSSCKIQNGFNCQNQLGGISRCQLIAYEVSRKQNSFISGNIVIQYQMKPPPARSYSSSQLQQMIKITFQTSPPYQGYLTQNPTNTAIFRYVGTYAGMIPFQPAIINVNFKLPSGNQFNDSIFEDFKDKNRRGAMFSRAWSRDDKHNPDVIV